MPPPPPPQRWGEGSQCRPAGEWAHGGWGWGQWGTEGRLQKGVCGLDWVEQWGFHGVKGAGGQLVAGCMGGAEGLEC